MDFSTCEPVKQFLSKYTNVSIKNTVKLCKDIIELYKQELNKEMDIVNKEKEMLKMTIKELRMLGKQRKNWKSRQGTC